MRVHTILFDAHNCVITLIKVHDSNILLDIFLTVIRQLSFKQLYMAC